MRSPPAGASIARTFPTDVTVFLIEAETLAFGVGLSPRVASAARMVADRIGELLEEARRELAHHELDPIA